MCGETIWILGYHYTHILCFLYQHSPYVIKLAEYIITIYIASATIHKLCCCFVHKSSNTPPPPPPPTFTHDSIPDYGIRNVAGYLELRSKFIDYPVYGMDILYFYCQMLQSSSLLIFFSNILIAAEKTICSVCADLYDTHTLYTHFKSFDDQEAHGCELSDSHIIKVV